MGQLKGHPLGIANPHSIIELTSKITSTAPCPPGASIRSSPHVITGYTSPALNYHPSPSAVLLGLLSAALAAEMGRGEGGWAMHGLQDPPSPPASEVQDPRTKRCLQEAWGRQRSIGRFLFPRNFPLSPLDCAR